MRTATVDGEAAALLQRRLRLMLAVLTAIAWVALPTHVILSAAVPATRTTHPTFTLIVFVGMTVGGTAGYLAARRASSLGRLRAIETAGGLGLSLMLTAVMVVPSGRIDEVYVAMVLEGFVVLGRALMIPSTTRRTLWISTACMLPIFGAVVGLALFTDRLTPPPVGFVTSSVFLCGFPILLAVAGSWVITGLRAEVRAARTLGQYTLGDKLGEGGMGAVYKAQHALLRRPTAIKLIRPDRTSADAIRRFEREVQLTAQLTDPHVVAIFDYGHSPDGVFYYAMEYLDGVDLERLVRDHGPQPAGRVVAILAQVCDALADAHARGLIHRDIKPANVILCERGTRADVVKVVDFGLVKDLDADAGASTSQIAGTPAYLAPEAIDDPRGVGPTSDLYAVGAVAYYLLTGATVFSARTFAELCDLHLHAVAAAPSTRTDRVISPEVDALILRCLARDPADRPASAAALRAELDALDVPAWTATDAEAWWRGFRAQALASPAPIDPIAETMAVGAAAR